MSEEIKNNDVLEDDFNEYAIFTITDQNGNEVEMAVIDEFEVDHKTYVSAAVIEDDMINEDGLYIYRVKVTSDDFEVEKITDKSEYEAVAQAYMSMEE